MINVLAIAIWLIVWQLLWGGHPAGIITTSHINMLPRGLALARDKIDLPHLEIIIHLLGTKNIEMADTFNR